MPVRDGKEGGEEGVRGEGGARVVWKEWEMEVCE